jgi:hypothetical protein
VDDSVGSEAYSVGKVCQLRVAEDGRMATSWQRFRFESGWQLAEVEKFCANCIVNRRDTEDAEKI